MSTKFADFQKKFKVDELILKEFKYWRWSLRPAQVAVPSTILSLRRPEEHLGGLTQEEASELSVVCKHIEEKLAEAFEFDKINYLALMMIDFHVHFHVLVRYSEQKDVEGIKISDRHWPGPPNVLDGIPLDADLKEKLSLLLK